MALGTALIIAAVGAVLRFAVHTNAHGFSIHTIGTILLILGIVGAVLALFQTAIWSRRPSRRGYYDPGY
jgi:beta-lactamase regulating signal transducer with metallopeptidase domain